MKDTVAEFTQDFRNRIGDSSGSVPQDYIISYINTMTRRIGRMEGLDRLYQVKITRELSTINADGTAAASWNLGKLGRIIDIESFRILMTNDGEVIDLRPIYREYNDFFAIHALPEQAAPGRPQYYTFEQVGTDMKLIFDRPPDTLVAIETILSAFPAKITSPDDVIPIVWEYADFLLDAVLILHKIETTDMSTARALYEDLDTMMLDIRETLARRKTSLGYRRVKRSF